MEEKERWLFSWVSTEKRPCGKVVSIESGIRKPECTILLFGLNQINLLGFS